MRSIKPGRGTSGMSFMGSVIGIIFGVFWTIIAFSITANSPFGTVGMIFPVFGILFIIMGIVQAFYHLKNTTGKNRFSVYDITDSSEESDPSDKWIKNELTYEVKNDNPTKASEETNFCPYCGVSIDDNYSFCPKCGKSIK